MMLRAFSDECGLPVEALCRTRRWAISIDWRKKRRASCLRGWDSTGRMPTRATAGAGAVQAGRGRCAGRWWGCWCGASSGKSTLFQFAGGARGQPDQRHTPMRRLGPIVAVASAIGRRPAKLAYQRLDARRADAERDAAGTRRRSARSARGGDQPTRAGRAGGAWCWWTRRDVTSTMSDEEGAITQRLVPWFDGLVVIVDEERWFRRVGVRGVGGAGPRFRPAIVDRLQSHRAGWKGRPGSRSAAGGSRGAESCRGALRESVSARGGVPAAR